MIDFKDQLQNIKNQENTYQKINKKIPKSKTDEHGICRKLGRKSYLER